MDDKIIWIIVGAILLSSILATINQLRNDVRRTNEILEKIAKQIGVPEPPVDDEIKSFVVQN